MILWLLLGLLLLPTLFAVPARMIARRGSARGAAIVAALGFAGCVACVVALLWLPLNTQALGRLQILLPSSDIVVAREAFVELQADGSKTSDGVSNPGEAGSPTLKPGSSATALPAAVPELAAAPESTATLLPTPLPEAPTALPTPLPEPTAALTTLREPAPAIVAQTTPEPAAEPEPVSELEPERYEVEAGDTLRGIAALYDVDAAELQLYNGLSNAEADSLEIGQVLFIPPN